MNYIDQLALRIYAISESGDLPSADDMPLYRIYAVLSLAKGTATTAEDVHDAWSAWASGHYPFEHRSAVPFDQLEEHVQRYDDKYVAAIHSVAPQQAEAA